MGVLDSTTPDADVPEDTKLDIPYWLAKEFQNDSMEKLWDVSMPEHYGGRMREEIEAGAGKIKFRDFSYYYFEIGIDLGRNVKGDLDLVEKLRKAFTGQRYNVLISRALTRWNDDNVDFSNSLTFMERNILEEGFKAGKELQKWRAGESFILESAVVGHRPSAGAEGSVSKRSRRN